MTDKIIIDGVDVSGCEQYKQAFTGFICSDPTMSNDCGKNPNCLYKQLARKTEECEKLKEKLKQARCSHYVLGECSQEHHGNCVGQDKCIRDLEAQLQAEQQKSEALQQSENEAKEIIAEMNQKVKELDEQNEILKIQLMKKDEVNTFFNTPIEGWSNNPCDICRYKQALAEIKEIAKSMNTNCFYYDFECNNCDMCNGCTYINRHNILQKCEVLDE